jgi:hypothetical protein
LTLPALTGRDALHDGDGFLGYRFAVHLQAKGDRFIMSDKSHCATDKEAA